MLYSDNVLNYSFDEEYYDEVIEPQIIEYLKYSRYRPGNILETIKVIILNFLLITYMVFVI